MVPDWGGQGRFARCRQLALKRPAAASAERLLTEAGFSVLDAKDTTANAAEISARWWQGRENSKVELIALEGEMNFEGLQQFLRCVNTLTSERRLLRYLYLAQKSQQ